MQAREVMTERPVTGSVKSTLGDVIETMLARDIRHLPIVAGDELVGMVSDRDIRQFSRDLINDPGASRQLGVAVGKVMSSDLITADPENDVDDLIEMMIENKVGAVPIVDADGVLVGIVSYIDILRAAAGKLG